MTRGRLALAAAGVAAVLVVIGLTATRGGHDDATGAAGAQPASSAAAAGPAANGSVAPVVQPDQVPELHGRPTQRDVDPDTPTVRSYARSHRLLAQLPQTYRGIAFDSAGRTPAGRVIVTANPQGLPASTVRSVYRRLLRRARDPGRAYRLRVLRPGAQAP